MKRLKAIWQGNAVGPVNEDQIRVFGQDFSYRGEIYVEIAGGEPVANARASLADEE